jgi:hypothetical protein
LNGKLYTCVNANAHFHFLSLNRFGTVSLQRFFILARFFDSVKGRLRLHKESALRGALSPRKGAGLHPIQECGQFPSKFVI